MTIITTELQRAKDYINENKIRANKRRTRLEKQGWGNLSPAWRRYVKGQGSFKIAGKTDEEIIAEANRMFNFLACFSSTVTPLATLLESILIACEIECKHSNTKFIRQDFIRNHQGFIHAMMLFWGCYYDYKGVYEDEEWQTLGNWQGDEKFTNEIGRDLLISMQSDDDDIEQKLLTSLNSAANMIAEICEEQEIEIGDPMVVFGCDIKISFNDNVCEGVVKFHGVEVEFNKKY